MRPALVAVALCVCTESIAAGDVIANLTAALAPILAAKSAKWSNSSLSIALRHGNRTLQLAAGYNDMVRKVAATAEDRFLFGSATKMVTAANVMQLVERGVLHLDEPMVPHVDAILRRGVVHTNYTWRSMEDLFGAQVNNVTIRHLLHMTSGILDYDDPGLRGFQNAHPLYDITPWDILNMCNKTFACAPGKCGAYSSTNFVILGLILAQHAQAADWDSFDQTTVFPAQLKPRFERTIFPLHGPCRKFAPVEHGYQQPPPGYYDVYNISCLGGWTCGNLVAPVQDVADFVYNLYGPPKAFVNRTSLTEMLQFTYLDAGAFPAWYGLGTMLLKFSNHSSDHKFHVDYVGHGGATYGFYSMVGYNAQYDFSLGLATNMETAIFQENLFDVHETIYAVTVGIMKAFCPTCPPRDATSV